MKPHPSHHLISQHWVKKDCSGPVVLAESQIRLHSQSRLTVNALACAQVGVLLAQAKLGPRCFIPRQFLPPKYDYFRAASRRSTHGVPRGDLGAEGDVETGDAGVECVICMTPVDAGRAKTRMVTPCGHFFHPGCLQRWMDIKLECPTCRQSLPPL